MKSAEHAGRSCHLGRARVRMARRARWARKLAAVLLLIFLLSMPAFILLLAKREAAKLPPVVDCNLGAPVG